MTRPSSAYQTSTLEQIVRHDYAPRVSALISGKSNPDSGLGD